MDQKQDGPAGSTTSCTTRFANFEIVPIPGKGRAWRATQNVPAGTLLYVTNIAVVRSRIPFHKSKYQGNDGLDQYALDCQRDVAKQVIEQPERFGRSADWYCSDNNLTVEIESEETAQTVPSFTDLDTWIRANAYVSTNAFETTSSGVSGSLKLYGPPFELLNHSCAPNACMWEYSEEDNKAPPVDEALLTPSSSRDRDNGARVAVYAAADIALGEEITISYMPLDIPTDRRQQKSLLSWGFACDCARCKLGLHDLRLLRRDNNRWFRLRTPNRYREFYRTQTLERWHAEYSELVFRLNFVTSPSVLYGYMRRFDRLRRQMGWSRLSHWCMAAWRRTVLDRLEALKPNDRNMNATKTKGFLKRVRQYFKDQIRLNAHILSKYHSWKLEPIHSFLQVFSYRGKESLFRDLYAWDPALKEWQTSPAFLAWQSPPLFTFDEE